MYHQLNIRISALRVPHDSQQKAIISLHNSNRLAFLMKARCVFCGVETQSSCVIAINSAFGGLIPVWVSQYIRNTALKLTSPRSTIVKALFIFQLGR
jgi:hypothetical protein